MAAKPNLAGGGCVFGEETFLAAAMVGREDECPVEGGSEAQRDGGRADDVPKGGPQGIGGDYQEKVTGREAHRQ